MMTLKDKKVYHTLKITAPVSHKRLDQLLAYLLPEYSRTQLQQWLKEGAILVDGKQLKANAMLAGTETITVCATLKINEQDQAEDIPLHVIFEDVDLLVINKPAGLVVHPAPGHSKHTLLNAVLNHHPQSALLPRSGILHRLDQWTSGLLVIAKNALALKELQHQLKKKAIKREYQAIVTGRLISGGTICAPIGRHSLKRKNMAVIDTGKPATTHYRVIEKFAHHTLLSVQLETGRTHQIRVHMQYIHHPILGDPTYGGRLKLQKNMSNELINALRHFPRQALHASALGFLHPRTREALQFSAPLPQDMTTLIEILREDQRQ